VVVDRKNKIVTTPCYMLATRISQVADGAEKAVRALLEMA
jgi:enhancing lycopene biosynthesis protein 2